MLQRLMIIYYGEDRLPYKDESRQVHYPIVNSTSGGTLITGENNTSKIYFYVNLIGGSELQWIANIKKPDGALSYQLLTNGQFIELSNGQVDYRVELDIAGMFADQVGDVYIGIQGYGGDTVIVEDDDTYQISGDPIVLGTGAIKIKVNYSPNVLPKGESLSPTVEQLILASLGSKADKSETIFVAPNILALNKNNFNENQMFLDQETRMFYKLVNNTFQPFQLSIADLFDAYTKTESNILFVPQSDVSADVTSNTIVKRDAMGQIKVPLSPYENYHATSKGYVDGVVSTLKANAFVKVDTSIYPTLADFLATTGEEGIIYLYPTDTSAYHQYIWEGNAWIDLGDTSIDLANYVTTDTVQTITGEKTFSEKINLAGPNYTGYIANEGNRIKFYYGGTERFRIGNSEVVSNSHFLPNITNNYDLGASSYTWKDLYIAGEIKFADGVSKIYNSSNKLYLFGNSGITISNNAGSKLEVAYGINPTVNGTEDLGSSSYAWRRGYINELYGVNYNFSTDDAYTVLFGKYVADNTITNLPYETISEISLSADTTFSLKSAPTGCYPIYSAWITNSSSSAITLTFNGVATFITNDEDNVVITNGTNTTISLGAGVTVEISIEKGHGIAVNHNVQ